MKKFVTLLVVLICVLGLCACGADSKTEDNAKVNTETTPLALTASYLEEQLLDNGTEGADWMLIGLSRCGEDVDSYLFAEFLKNEEKRITELNGILDESKYTEYSREILVLTALGENAAAFGGYDLTLPLADFNQVCAQGLNGPIWALIALNSGNYEIPQNDAVAVQATKDMYLEKILSTQNPDGSFPLSAGNDGDVDITAMALTALSYYQDRAEVTAAVDNALSYLSEVQTDEGGFMSWDETNTESDAQVIVALCSLGIGLDDSRFVKNNNVLEHMLTFGLEDGSFVHTSEQTVGDAMATEQAFYAMVAADLYEKGESPLFQFKE